MSDDGTIEVPLESDFAQWLIDATDKPGQGGIYLRYWQIDKSEGKHAKRTLTARFEERHPC